MSCLLTGEISQIWADNMGGSVFAFAHPSLPLFTFAFAFVFAFVYLHLYLYSWLYLYLHFLFCILLTSPSRWAASWAAPLLLLDGRGGNRPTDLWSAIISSSWWLSLAQWLINNQYNNQWLSWSWNGSSLWEPGHGRCGRGGEAYSSIQSSPKNNPNKYCSKF